MLQCHVTVLLQFNITVICYSIMLLFICTVLCYSLPSYMNIGMCACDVLCWFLMWCVWCDGVWCNVLDVMLFYGMLFDVMVFNVMVFDVMCLMWCCLMWCCLMGCWFLCWCLMWCAWCDGVLCDGVWCDDDDATELWHVEPRSDCLHHVVRLSPVLLWGSWQADDERHEEEDHGRTIWVSRWRLELHFARCHRSGHQVGPQSLFYIV